MSTKNLKERFECELCIECFNQYDRRPFSLVPCGHTICLACLNKLEINKTQCPFCRVEMELKIPNWEVIKRLPKAAIPLMYNQVKIKLESFTLRIDKDFLKTSAELTSTIELIGKLIDLINQKLLLDKNKSNIKDREYANKVISHQTFLANFCAKKSELGNYLNLRIENFKVNVEKEENKYNEQNLKVMKLEIEKLDKSLNTKIELIKESNQKLANLLNKITRQVEFEHNEDTVQLEEELGELKRIALITQLTDVPGFMSFSLNVVRPASTTSSHSHLQNGQQVVLDNEKKVKLCAFVVILFALSGVYPIAMIITGKVYMEECSMNNLIPIWCVVSGSSFLLFDFITATLLIYLIIRVRNHKSYSEKLLVILLLVIPLIIILLFYVAWFFAGNSWIYSAYNTVQFSDTTTTGTFCNQTLYLFSFWTLNVAYICVGIVLLIGNLFCCIYCFVNSKQ